MKLEVRTEKKYDLLCTVHGDICTRINPDFDGEWIYEIDSSLVGYVYLKNSKTGEVYKPQLIFKFVL